MQSFKTGLVILLLVVFLPSLSAENFKEILSLKGSWKFSIGDDTAWAQPGYNDLAWDIVQVPASWEQNGYDEYNGFAWYRKPFTLNYYGNQQFIYLLAGYIDDVDEVYINGQLVGSSGMVQPLVVTAYSSLRKYPVPVELLNRNGENTIAVRVYDDYLEGGIYRGPVGFYEDRDAELLELNLAGYWNFETTNKTNPTKKPVFGQNPGEIFVPGTWENWGYTGYDGAATYTTSFTLTQTAAAEPLMMVLGYIDDVDKVYLNGNLIGTVDVLMKRSDPEGSEYRKLRGYKIPTALLKYGQPNTILVKVYDTGGPGGIVEGPVGIATVANFEKIAERQKPASWWDEFFQMFWD